MRRLSMLIALAALVPGFVRAQEASALPFDLARVKLLDLPRVDLRQARAADEKRQLDGRVAHFAVALDVDVAPLERPLEYGKWAFDPSNFYWRLRIRSRGALSLSLAFTRFRLPEGASLTVYSVDGRERVGPFTARDNEAHGRPRAFLVMAQELCGPVQLRVLQRRR